MSRFKDGLVEKLDKDLSKFSGKKQYYSGYIRLWLATPHRHIDNCHLPADRPWYTHRSHLYPETTSCLRRCRSFFYKLKRRHTTTRTLGLHGESSVKTDNGSFAGQQQSLSQ